MGTKTKLRPKPVMKDRQQERRWREVKGDVAEIEAL